MKQVHDVFTTDEEMMLMLYFHGDRTGTIVALSTMASQLTESETELSFMTATLIGKLRRISDNDFLQLDSVQSVIS